MIYDFNSRLESVLNEMPMSLTKVGDWNEQDSTGNWDERSLKVFGSEKAVNKITRIADRVLYNFNVYLVRLNSESALNKIGYTPAGTCIPLGSADYFYKSLGITRDQAPIYSDRINLFLVAWQDEPPTAWMILHRFAHTSSNLFMYPAYEAVKRYIKAPGRDQLRALESVLTMRSARSHRLNNMDEALREAMAQYLMNGSVQLQSDDNQFSRFVDADNLEASLNKIFKDASEEFYKHIYIM